MQERMHPLDRVRRRGGFTLVEILVAVLLGTMLLGSVWVMIEVSGRQQSYTQATLESDNAMAMASLALHRDLARAGHGLPATYNWSGIQVTPSGTEGEESDTLTIFWANGPAYPVSSRSCAQTAENCVAVVGSVADSIRPGDLVVVALGRIGARLYQVNTVYDPRIAPCGADCAIPRVVCSDQVLEAHIAPVVTGSVLYDPFGVVLETRSTPCEQSYFPDGSQCTELIDLQFVGNALRSACDILPTPEKLYTDLVLVDRTNIFGVPAPPAFSLYSGAEGAPQVVVQKVGFARYWIDHSGERPSLVRQDVLEVDGNFKGARVVAGTVERFRVDVRHAGSSEFVRGVGVDAANLDRSLANPNFARAIDRVISPNEPGYSFQTSYRNIASVRIQLRVRSSMTTRGLARSNSLEAELIFATPALLEGGAFRLAQP